MNYVCSDCGYESDNPGNCPECETPLLKREDEGVLGVEKTEEATESEGMFGGSEDEEDDGEW